MQNKPTAITIHIETAHSCGQVFEQVVYIDVDEDFILTHYFDDLSYFAGGISDQGDKFWIPPLYGRHQFTVSGYYSKVSITGVERVDHRMLCPTCGANLLFPESEP